MSLQFDPLNHIYTFDGVHIPGVNEVIDSIGVRSRCGECHGAGCIEDAQCDQCRGTGYTSYKSLTGSEFMGDSIASSFGINLHDFIKYDQQGIECKYDPALQPWITGYEKFKKAYDIRPQLIEEPMYHPLFKYAGTPDFFGHRYIQKPKTNVLILLDWKSGLVGKLTKVAMAAYEELIKVNLKTRRKIHKLCVQLLPDGYKLIPYKGADFNTFLSFLNIYKLFNKKDS